MNQNSYNLITYILPDKIKLDNGNSYQLLTWTSRAIDVITAMENKTLTESEKIRYAISRLVIVPVDHIERYRTEIYSKILEYLKGAPTPEYESSNLPRSHEPLIYWDLDSPAIVASFRETYGISLEQLQKMHWWEFRALLFNIPSSTRIGTLFATRMSLVDRKAKQDDQNRQSAIKKGAKPKDIRKQEEKEQDALDSLSRILG